MSVWHHGAIDFPEGRVDPDGATYLFELLVDRSLEAFQRFAEDYYEVSVDPGRWPTCTPRAR